MITPFVRSVAPRPVQLRSDRPQHADSTMHIVECRREPDDIAGVKAT
jgi:hypothetical protein